MPYAVPLVAPVRFLLLFAAVLLLATGCQDTSVLDDLDDASYQLVDQDSMVMTVPDDLEGKPTLMGFVYTHCPDICPITTANMKQVRERLEAPEEVQFVTVTFDPVRDTPSVLRRYRDAYGLEDTDWLFLTGDTTTVARMMERFGVRSEVSYTSTTEAGEEVYFIDHSDQVTLLDERGRIVRHYGGSVTPPEILVEDINALRDAS
jgi:protein SCO1/2